MGYTIPVGNYLYRNEIPGRFLHYLGEEQRHTKRYLKHLHRVYEVRRRRDPSDPYLVHLGKDIAVTIQTIKTRADAIYQMHILLHVYLKGKRTRPAKV